MPQIRVHRLLVATFVAAVLATAPALAAPPRSAAPTPPAALAGGWADVTAPLLSFVSPRSAGGDAALTAWTPSGGPDAAPESRLTIDPDG